MVVVMVVVVVAHVFTRRQPQAASTRPCCLAYIAAHPSLLLWGAQAAEQARQAIERAAEAARAKAEEARRLAAEEAAEEAARVARAEAAAAAVQAAAEAKEAARLRRGEAHSTFTAGSGTIHTAPVLWQPLERILSRTRRGSKTRSHSSGPG